MLKRKVCRHLRIPLLLTAATCLLGGCFVLLPPEVGGMTEYEPPREIDPDDIALPSDFENEAIATGLEVPTDVAFDEQGHIFTS